jgi:hypothetical protein
VADGLAGTGIAARGNSTELDDHWRNSLSSRPCVAAGTSYDDQWSAHRYGYERYPEYRCRQFDAVEPAIRQFGSRRQVTTGRVLSCRIRAL